MDAKDLQAIEAMFKRQIGVLSESFQHKLDLVVEGHDVLRREIREVHEETNAKHDQSAFLLNALNTKLDGIAADLTAHRKDTEAHGACGW